MQTKTSSLEGWQKYPCLETKQPGGSLYTIVMSGKNLVSKSAVLARALSGDGIQRVRSPARCRRIARFYAMEDCVLPGNIIGTVDKTHVQIKDGCAYFSPDFVNEVIDGQHRLWGFDPEFNEKDVDFDVLLTFLISAGLETKAKLFYKINHEQKKINPSLAYDLLVVMGDKEMQGEVARIVTKLNEEEDSPFKDVVKIQEKSEGMISMASMAHKIEQFLRGPTGKRFFKSKEEINSKALYEIMKNYFTAIRELFPNQWVDPECVLLKTLGYGAFMELLPEVITEHTSKNGRTIPSTEQMKKILKPLESFDFDDAEVTSLGGEKGQKYLASLLSDEIGFSGFEEVGG